MQGPGRCRTNLAQSRAVQGQGRGTQPASGLLLDREGIGSWGGGWTVRSAQGCSVGGGGSGLVPSSARIPGVSQGLVTRVPLLWVLLQQVANEVLGCESIRDTLAPTRAMEPWPSLPQIPAATAPKLCFSSAELPGALLTVSTYWVHWPSASSSAQLGTLGGHFSADPLPPLLPAAHQVPPARLT